MKPYIIPIVTPNIDWAEYLKITREMLGYSLSRKLDERNIELGNAASFVATLAALQGNNGELQDVILKSGTLKDHLSFTFLICVERSVTFEIASRTNLRVTSAETIQRIDIIIASGTLSQWFEASLEFCSETASADARLIFDALVLVFEKTGLKPLWKGYEKKWLPDKTFRLEKQ